MAGDTLTIRLEARSGQWHPDGDAKPSIIVNALGVEGGPLQIPAPLIRVTEGTEIRAIGTQPPRRSGTRDPRNDTRPSPAADPPPAVIIPAGETHEFRFLAGRPGTYYYWAASAAETLLNLRTGSDSPLSGALIVDPRGSQASPDRVLLISSWNNGAPPGSPDRVSRFVINGRSSPCTRTIDVPSGRHGANAHHQRRRGRPPDASARLLFQRRQSRRRTRGHATRPMPGRWREPNVRRIPSGRRTVVTSGSSSLAN